MIFNERLKLLRKERKLTQTQVAKELSVSLRNYQRFEADDCTPNYVNLIKLADIFDVSIDYLTGRTDKREINR
ncbi:MAG: helix-turn-helix transcriptional regulator [Lawsonibacter sp.]|nr:helix-turn-helix transcriptional regulator [Lawsonibacter sp.]